MSRALFLSLLVACTTDPPDEWAAGVAGPPTGPILRTPQIEQVGPAYAVAGGKVRILVSGAEPGQLIGLVRSDDGPGTSAYCPNAMRGHCAEVVDPELIGLQRADDDGRAAFEGPLPPRFGAGTQRWYQAGAGRRVGFTPNLSDVIVVTSERPSREVVPAVGNGDAWNDYVVNDGATALESFGAPCIGDEPGPDGCFHAGERRMYYPNGLTSCAGITAEDSLGALNWSCDDSLGVVRIFSTRIRQGVGLVDLLNLATMSFRTMSLRVFDNGVEVDRSPMTVWWSNPVSQVTASTSSLDVESGVYVVSSDVSTSGLRIEADGVALTTAPFATLSWDGNSVDNCNEDDMTTVDVDETCMVASAANDFLWFEGNYDAELSDDASITLGTANTGYSVFRNIDMIPGDDGITVYGTSYGVRVSDMEITDGDSDAIGFDGVCDGCSIERIRSTDVGSDVIDAKGATDLVIRDILGIRAGNDVIDFSDVDGALIEDVVVAGTEDEGLELAGSSDLTVRRVRMSGTESDGILLQDAGAGNVFEDIEIVTPGYEGIDVQASLGASWRRIRVADCGHITGDGTGFEVEQSRDQIVHDLSASNCGSEGIYLEDATDNVFTEVRLIGNDDAVLSVGDSKRNTFSHVTIANSEDDGLDIEDAGEGADFTFVSTIIANSGGDGFAMTGSDGVMVANLAVWRSGFDGIDFTDVTSAQFTGTLHVGGSSDLDCEMDNATGLIDTTCANEGTSDATTYLGIDLGGAFAGLVTVDGTNTDHVAGEALYDTLTDWFAFDNRFRVWGRNAPVSDTAAQSDCDLGETCRISDWRLSSSDAVLLDRSGDGTLNVAASDGAPCPAGVQGNETVTDGLGNTFLINALEIVGDGDGDEDGLCESSETCVYSPNVGAYQGEGDPTAAACVFADGVVTGVTMRLRAANGAP
jgi:hypothetical protein